jgi:HAE1 family hydrophobic/amphiphilic exporter-1
VVPRPENLPAGVRAPSHVELTNWADQVLKKRLENVRGVGSVTLVGGTKREINLYLNPQAHGGLGHQRRSGGERRAPVKTKTCRWARCARLRQDRVVQVQGRMLRPEDFGDIIVARTAAPPRCGLSQVAGVKDGAQEVENLALYNGASHPVAVQCKSRKTKTPSRWWMASSKRSTRCEPQLPPACSLESVHDGSRPIRVAVNNVRKP